MLDTREIEEKLRQARDLLELAPGDRRMEASGYSVEYVQAVELTLGWTLGHAVDPLDLAKVR